MFSKEEKLPAHAGCSSLTAEHSDDISSLYGHLSPSHTGKTLHFFVSQVQYQFKHTWFQPHSATFKQATGRTSSEAGPAPSTALPPAVNKRHFSAADQAQGVCVLDASLCDGNQLPTRWYFIGTSLTTRHFFSRASTSVNETQITEGCLPGEQCGKGSTLVLPWCLSDPPCSTLHAKQPSCWLKEEAAR